MVNAKAHLDAIGKIHAAHFGTAEEQAMMKRLAAVIGAALTAWAATHGENA